MILGILILIVKGEGSKEFSEITSLFSSMAYGGLAFILLEEGFSAPFISVGRENCRAREESGCCSWCFYSVKEARFSVYWSSGFISREVICVISLTMLLFYRA